METQENKPYELRWSVIKKPFIWLSLIFLLPIAWVFNSPDGGGYDWRLSIFVAAFFSPMMALLALALRAYWKHVKNFRINTEGEFLRIHGRPPRSFRQALTYFILRFIYTFAFFWGAAFFVSALADHDKILVGMTMVFFGLGGLAAYICQKYKPKADDATKKKKDMKTEKENQTADDCPYYSVIFRLGWRIHRYLDNKYYFWVIKKYFRRMEGLNKQLSRCRRIDLIPTKGKGRSFMLILDNRETLKFSQEGDHFIYEGCDIAKYENGDVTIFDNLEK